MITAAIDRLPSCVSDDDRVEVEASLVREAAKNDAEIVKAVDSRKFVSIHVYPVTGPQAEKLGHVRAFRSWLIVGRRNRGPRRSHSPRPRRAVPPMGDRLDVVLEFHAAARAARRVPRRTHSRSPGGCVGYRHRGRGRACSPPRHTFLHGRSTRRRAVAAIDYRAIGTGIGVTLCSSFCRDQRWVDRAGSADVRGRRGLL